MNKEKKNLLVFGYGLALILAFISFKLFRDHGWGAMHAVLVSCVVALIFVTKVRYELLRPLYKRWMKVAHFIGSVITGFILSVLFYFVFGFIGLLMRLLKKDLLDQKIDNTADSYWIKKDQIDFDKSHYTRQF